MSGKERTSWLNDALNHGMDYYLGPTGIPDRLRAIGLLNPINSMSEAQQGSMLMLHPDATPGQRLSGGLQMATGMAETLVPAVAPKIAKVGGDAVDAAAQTVDSLLGFGMPQREGVRDAAAQFARSEYGGPGTAPVTWQAARVGDSPHSLRYSPSSLAAQNMKQPRGTYDQMRAGLIKGGAKPEELVWSGFDQRFMGRDKIDLSEIQEYLADPNNTNIVSNYTQTAEGIVGHQGITDDGIESAIERYIDDSLDDEIGHLRDDWLYDNIMYEAQRVDELTEYPSSFDAEDVESYLKKWPDAVYWEGSDDFYPNEEALMSAAEEYYDLENMARENLDQSIREDLQYDRNIAYERLGIDETDDAFDAGDTHYGDYFTPGARNYTEKAFDFANQDTLGTRVSSAAHSGLETENSQLLHTRSGRFGDAYHLGEIQSDWAQGARRDAQRNGRQMATPEQEFELANAGGGVNSLTAYGRVLDESAQDALSDARWANEMPHGYARPGPLVYEPVVARASGPSIVRTSINGDTSPYFTNMFLDSRLPSGHPNADSYAAGGGRYGMDPRAGTPEYDNSRFPHLRYLHDNRPMDDIPGGLPGFEDGPVQAVSRGFHERNEGFSLPDLLSRIEKVQEIENTTPTGPLVSGSTDKWVLEGFRANLEDALRDPQVSRFTLGTGDLATDMTMGTSHGQGSFYDKIVPKVVSKELKRYGAKLEPMQIETGKGNKPVLGFNLSPEFREAVRKKGIPTFATIPGAFALGQKDDQEYQ